MPIFARPSVNVDKIYELAKKEITSKFGPEPQDEEAKRYWQASVFKRVEVLTREERRRIHEKRSSRFSLIQKICKFFRIPF